MNAIEFVEAALDLYVASMPFEPKGFRARTLAKLVDIPPELMGRHLQEYRLRQATDPSLRYLIAAQGYGQAARWVFLRRADADVDEMAQANRLFQANHIIEDLSRRFRSDLATELYPALSSEESWLEPIMKHFEEGLRSMVDLALSFISLYRNDDDG